MSLSMYYPLFLEARVRNKSESFREEMALRQTTAEGVFASQDRLGWAISKLRSLWKVDFEGSISALAYNLKKAVRRLNEELLSLTPAPEGKSA